MRQGLWKTFVDCQMLKKLLYIMVLTYEGCSWAIELDSGHTEELLQGQRSSCQHE